MFRPHIQIGRRPQRGHYAYLTSPPEAGTTLATFSGGC
ncbi:hypothetical protein ABH994_003564 [Bradyrhizobium yuanmingense]